jgi:hypothetical protein
MKSETNIENTLAPIRPLAMPGLRFDGADIAAGEVAQARQWLSDPTKREAMWVKIMDALLVDGAIMDARWQKEQARIASELATAESQRKASVEARQAFWKNAEVRNIEQTINFAYSPIVGWNLAPLRMTEGQLVPIGRQGRNGVSLSGDTSLASRDGVFQHFTGKVNDATGTFELHPDDLLGLSVKDSSLVILKGHADDLEILDTRWTIPATLSWDYEGVEHRVYRRFGAAFNGALWRSVELVAQDVLVIPPSGNARWIVSPSQFGAMLQNDETGIPALPQEFVTLLSELSTAQNRSKFIEALM